jgi:eukaryotic-like serine/threonine-protein kinase
MTRTERWRRTEALFEQAVELPEPARAGFLDEHCADDPELRRELAGLLASASASESAGAASVGPSLRGAIATEVQALASQVASAQVGRRLGAYRLIGLLGEGGMGAVYLAERDDAEYAHRVAIKLLPHAVGSPAMIARFRDERQILAALEHPNIVRLLDGGSTDDELPYLVMEHIEGTTITRYAEDREPAVRARIALIRRVCGALQYAHQNLVVHRDIKPSNILVDRDGEPKILDFGIAKLLSPVDRFEREARTHTGFAMFTPQYASPEQARGDAVSTATDVYSLGAVLYELVTGQPPVRAMGSALEILRTICEIDPPRPSAVAPGSRRRELAGDLDNIILKALHKDPARRYASMDQLASDLGRWLDGLPVTARTATLGYRAGKFVRRNKAAVAALTVVIASLLAATVVSLHQATRADEQAGLADTERGKAIDAATRAQTEADRARKAEAQLQVQLQQLRAAQSARAVAEATAQDKTSEAELSREQLQVALEQAREGRRVAEQEKQLAQQESQKAREAEARAEAAARTEKALREEMEALYQKERERARQLEEAKKKITSKLP